MAKSINVVKQKKRNPKTGRLQTTSVSKTISTNVAKGANKGPAPKSDSAKIKLTKIQSDASVAKANIAAKTAIHAGYASQLGAIGKQAFTRDQGLVKTQDQGVNQNINGGVTSSQPGRYEDDDPFID